MTNEPNHLIIPWTTAFAFKVVILLLAFYFAITLLGRGYSLKSNLILLLILPFVCKLFVEPSYIEIDICNGTVIKNYRVFCGIGRKAKLYQYRSINLSVAILRHTGNISINYVELIGKIGGRYISVG
jgi:hypothetical protein